MSNYERDTEPYTPPVKYGPRFTAVDVRKVRDEYDCGLVTAKGILMRKQIQEDLANGKCSLNVGLLYDVLLYLTENQLINFS